MDQQAFVSGTGGDPPEDAGQSPHRTIGNSLTIPNLLLLLFAVGAAAAGQLLLKHGMTGVAAAVERDGGPLLVKAATSPWVIGGLVVFLSFAALLVLDSKAKTISKGGPVKPAGKRSA